MIGERAPPAAEEPRADAPDAAARAPIAWKTVPSGVPGHDQRALGDAARRDGQAHLARRGAPRRASRRAQISSTSSSSCQTAAPTGARWRSRPFTQSRSSSSAAKERCRAGSRTGCRSGSEPGKLFPVVKPFPDVGSQGSTVRSKSVTVGVVVAEDEPHGFGRSRACERRERHPRDLHLVVEERVSGRDRGVAAGRLARASERGTARRRRPTRRRGSGKLRPVATWWPRRSTGATELAGAHGDPRRGRGARDQPLQIAS